MASPEILPQSPSEKGRADLSEDIENGLNKEDAPAEDLRVEVTEEEVSIYSAADLNKASNTANF